MSEVTVNELSQTLVDIILMARGDRVDSEFIANYAERKLTECGSEVAKRAHANMKANDYQPIPILTLKGDSCD